MRFFALTVPGLGSLLRKELAQQVEAVGEVEYDGRSDVVPLTAAPSLPIETRLAEDLFVEIGTGDARAPLSRLAGHLWSSSRYDAALPAIAPRLGSLGPRPGFHVVARLRAERGFLRTELRDELARAVLRERPRWRLADPAPLELWALQTRPTRVRLGVRLTDQRMRQRGGREVERPGALRPVVAAAMLKLAELSTELRLLDPCCGAGTIVREALDTGLAGVGADMALEAIRAARSNLPVSTPLVVADARALPFRSGFAGAIVCNLPFGRRYHVEQPTLWLRQAFTEFERLAAPGGAIVLLTPPSAAFEAAVLRPRAERLSARHPIKLLGLPTTIWAFRARG
jgi:SAM-dependent methyltransferase